MVNWWFGLVAWYTYRLIGVTLESQATGPQTTNLPLSWEPKVPPPKKAGPKKALLRKTNGFS